MMGAIIIGKSEPSWGGLGSNCSTPEPQVLAMSFSLFTVPF